MPSMAVLGVPLLVSRSQAGGARTSALVTPLLTVDAIGVRVGGTMPLRNISFTLSAADEFALLGANGAGKSTLVATLAGELPLTGGCIELDGRPLTAWSAAELAGRRALNASEPAVPFALSVADYVAPGQPLLRRTQRLSLPRWPNVMLPSGAGATSRRLSRRANARFCASLYQLGRPLSSTRNHSHAACGLLDEPCAHLDAWRSNISF